MVENLDSEVQNDIERKGNSMLQSALWRKKKKEYLEIRKYRSLLN